MVTQAVVAPKKHFSSQFTVFNPVFSPLKDIELISSH